MWDWRRRHENSAYAMAGTTVEAALEPNDIILKNLIP